MIELQQNPYAWPIKRALTKPVLVLGTEKVLVVLNATLCMAYALASHFTWVVAFVPVLFIFIHGFCMAISHHDPRMIAIFKRSTRYKQGPFYCRRAFFPALRSIESTYARKFSAFPDEVTKKFKVKM